MCRLRSCRELRSVERGKGTGHTLAVSLVARNAVGAIHLLTARDEILALPHLAHIFGAGRDFFLLVIEPFVEIVLRLHFDDDGHEAVLLATELRALATINPRLFGLEP